MGNYMPLCYLKLIDYSCHNAVASLSHHCFDFKFIWHLLATGSTSNIMVDLVPVILHDEQITEYPKMSITLIYIEMLILRL